MAAPRNRTPSDRLNVQKCCRFLGALAEPERLRIVQALLAGPRTVGEVCRLLDLPVANTSHHLKQLRSAGLVEGVKRGRFVVYSLAPGVFRQPPAPDTAGPGAGDPAHDVLDFGCCQLDLGHRPLGVRTPSRSKTAT
jgi:DNA-binding transcriptional ArsR family regulator